MENQLIKITTKNNKEIVGYLIENNEHDIKISLFKDAETYSKFTIVWSKELINHVQKLFTYSELNETNNSNDSIIYSNTYKEENDILKKINKELMEENNALRNDHKLIEAEFTELINDKNKYKKTLEDIRVEANEYEIRLIANMSLTDFDNDDN